jgi:hypothetical protein
MRSIRHFKEGVTLRARYKTFIFQVKTQHGGSIKLTFYTDIFTLRLRYATNNLLRCGSLPLPNWHVSGLTLVCRVSGNGEDYRQCAVAGTSGHYTTSQQQ